MRLWVQSDLHLESTRDWDLPAAGDRPAFDVLVIAGDLIPRAERGIAWLLDRVPDRPIILVPGNHEAYGVDVDRTVEKAMAAAAGSQLSFLSDRTVVLGDTIFVGSTLWTDYALHGDPQRAMELAGDRMNDHKKIRINDYAQRFLPRHARARHIASRAFIEGELRKPRGDRKLVVITHHAPVPADPGGAGDDASLDPAYRSDVTRLMSPAPDDGRGALRPADLWVYGHTHESFDRTIGGTRVVSNAKGYGPWGGKETTWENHNFDPHLVIEI